MSKYSSNLARFVKKARRWEIVYRFDGKLRRDSFGLNRLKNLNEREKAFNKKLKDVVNLLRHEIDPRFPDAIDQLKAKQTPTSKKKLPSDTNIIEAFDFAFKLAVANRSQRTLESYRSDMNVFKAWLKATGYEKKSVGSFKKLDALKFLDYLTLERKTRYGKNLQPRSVENYRLNMKNFCNYLVEREMMAVNVFHLCKPIRYRKVKRQALEDLDMKKLREYAQEHDPILLLIMMLVYGCLFRTIELGRLKVSFFNLKKQLISLPPDEVIKKSNPEEKFKRIPDYLVLPIAEHIAQSNPDDFFFSADNLKTGSEKCPKNMIANRFKNARDACGLSSKVILYRFKSSGIDDIIDQTNNTYELQFQACWDNISTADEYMNRRKAASDKMTKLKMFGE